MRRTGGVGVRTDQDELITAQTGNRVLLAHSRIEPVCQRHQQFITYLMPQRIVDVLEMVQVKEHDGQ